MVACVALKKINKKNAEYIIKLHLTLNYKEITTSNTRKPAAKFIPL